MSTDFCKFYAMGNLHPQKIIRSLSGAAQRAVHRRLMLDVSLNRDMSQVLLRRCPNLDCLRKSPSGRITFSSTSRGRIVILNGIFCLEMTAMTTDDYLRILRIPLIFIRFLLVEYLER